MRAPDRRSFPEAFHERVKDWWFMVVLAFSVVVTGVSALVRQL